MKSFSSDRDSRENLFVSLYRSCAESMSCENLSRLIAMERVEKSIEEMFENPANEKNRVRQEAVSEELPELSAAFEAVASWGIRAQIPSRRTAK